MKRRKLGLSLILLGLIGTWIGCSSQKEVINGTGKGNPIIILLKTSCFGNQCSAYEMQLLDNRVMLLNAMKNMDKNGHYKRLLSKAEYQQLLNTFIESHFFDFQDEYTAEITDLPSVYLTFNYLGKTKKVRDYYGAPESLKELELMVQSFLDRVGWEKVE